ncbi:flagellar basal-body rod protein FlgB [Clostridium sp. USBA 49]|jgi:flagellar basal-body rod protein FlgB|uniref:flagellar basal body rod protein FlgB n=1 Tax=Clostridium TaxID=1485 RepID=UPI00099A630C|nr:MULTISPECIES: flagellar basal body rod protein FlgB [Clostridium]SKA72699.1 flagellar basal-body rod protein FlgB [Clostridium sp. USBA 49]
MNELSKSQYVYELLKKSLDASSLRSKVIANNIANINTKGYKRYNVSFEESLKNSVDNLNLKTTDKKHINDGKSLGNIKIEQDTSRSMREDGNNVDIDNEMTNQAANSLMYNALISQVNSRIALERYVINEGRR